MQGFIESLKPFLKRFGVETLLLCCAGLITIISIVLYLQQNRQDKIAPQTVKSTENTNTSPPRQAITVDVSGAVKNPFVYTLTGNARIVDALEKAGGMIPDADQAFVHRTINLARILHDQEKIYIPFLSDIENGYVLENKRVIDLTQPNIVPHSANETYLMNINEASVIELDQLPGIGKVQSEAIFNGRPYLTTEDLVKKNVIKQSVYNKIKDLISLY